MTPKRTSRKNGRIDVSEIFGINVFNDKLMRERLPKGIYKRLRATIDRGEPLRPEIADVVASAMKDWAIEKGATHYTHWFQPLTGITAEKHDSFISPTDDGGVIMEFSGKQLIQGEPDASSFPSGGLRATFEARGYTAWDATSPAFLKEDAAGNVTLCIPTAFYSYHGHALDKKTPLLRSMDAVSKQALRVLRALGNTTSSKVTSTVGPEQEYFLVDARYFAKRLDLVSCGRTLFGAPAPKGQELEDHYFGAIKDRVSDFMKDLDIELWKMGISSKTKHNEVAPAQFEMAPIFTTTNIATDHNQLVMETLQKVALRQGLVCLLHEKPYAGINGSGKHNNWSLATDDGVNLLEPGTTPHDNMQFLLFIAALLRAVDLHADLLRASIASPGNDHRLGANEAPPAIVSIFMGDELTDILDKLGKGLKVEARGASFLKVGVDTLPTLPKDNTDRNRTSPFAFTGNKFEFRAVGSAASIAGPNVVINTIVAETLDDIATRLERATDKKAEAQEIIRDYASKHQRVIFNGNGYSEEWVAEAARRDLPNVRDTVGGLRAYMTDKAARLFEKYQVLSKDELHSRYDIYMENYAKVLNIEACTALQMARRQYIPSAIEFTTRLAGSVAAVSAAGGSAKAQRELLTKVSGLLDAAMAKTAELDAATCDAQATEDVTKRAMLFRDRALPVMNALRADVDALERIVAADLWPVPTYAELLYGI